MDFRKAIDWSHLTEPELEWSCVVISIASILQMRKQAYPGQGPCRASHKAGMARWELSARLSFPHFHSCVLRCLATNHILKNNR